MQNKIQGNVWPSHQETEVLWIGLNMVLLCFKLMINTKVEKILIYLKGYRIIIVVTIT